MFKKIVVGHNGSEQSADATALAGEIAGATGAHVLFTFVSPEWPTWWAEDHEYELSLRQDVHAALDPAVASLPEGVRSSTMPVPSTSKARGIHDVAETEHADLIVIGSAHRGALGRAVAGGTAEMLLSGAPCALAVAPAGFRDRAGESIDVVGAAFNGSPESEVALGVAGHLATATGASLKAITVAESPGLWHAAERVAPKHSHEHEGRHRDETRERLAAAVGALGANGVEEVVLDGHPVETLAEAAADTDLLVLGSRGYGPFRHVLPGSVSGKVMRSAATPTMIVPRGAPTPD